MRFQLVLQFRGDSLADYDAMIGLENDLNESLSNESAEVDGHDFGSGEMNIFIYTDEPNKTFERVRPILIAKNMFGDVIAAFREVSGEEYSVIWPKDCQTPFRIT